MPLTYSLKAFLQEFIKAYHCIEKQNLNFKASFGVAQRLARRLQPAGPGLITTWNQKIIATQTHCKNFVKIRFLTAASSLNVFRQHKAPHWHCLASYTTAGPCCQAASCQAAASI
jgi:hypothetical protein